MSLRAPLIPLAVILLQGLASAGEDADFTFFETRIRPLLIRRCFGCHAGETDKLKGGLSFERTEAWQKGGRSGPAVVAGKPDESRLILAVRRTDQKLRMPPDEALPAAEVNDLVEWVRSGALAPPTPPRPLAPPAKIDLATARALPLFQPPKDPVLPAVRDSAWPRNAVDRFVLAALEGQGLRPAAAADKATLLRRASFDVLGLPPLPEELAAFQDDQAPDAWERVVARLLASPHFGERQARRWLDLARYSDSNGLDENLAMANAWRYRDWVVRAFNADLPYDQFVRDQVAGDLLPEPADEATRLDRISATGFLALGPKMLAEQDKEKLVMDTVDEQIDVLGRTVLGLTLGCARCHDHKFDPIGIRDYYALAGIFRSTSSFANLDHVSHWLQAELGTKAQIEARATWQRQHTQGKKVVDDLTARGQDLLHAGLRQNLAGWLLAGTELSRRVELVETEEHSRGNLIADQDNWGTPDTTVARTGNPGSLQWCEYDVTTRSGPHVLEVRYASAEKRPMRLSLNGKPAAPAVLGETTGGFHPADQRWRALGVFMLLPGRNVLRLEADGPVPHLDKLALLPVPDGEAPAAWRTRVPGDYPVEVLRQVTDTLVRSERSGKDPVLALWHAFAALPEEDFPARAEALTRNLREGKSALAQTLLAGLPPQSLRELAGRYQILVSALPVDRRSKPAKGEAETQALHRSLWGGRGLFSLPPRVAQELEPPDLRQPLAEARAALAALKRQEPPALDRVLAVTDGKPADLPVHLRGNHLTLARDDVPRGTPELFAECVPLEPIGKDQSGRLQLARWLTHPDHPLTARVMANRVWQALFGQGLVRTPSNFGVRGEAPTHPELLDWLARELVRGKWSVKELYRVLLTSESYRMGSEVNQSAAQLDPENKLLWRMPRKRLEPEQLRDALLAIGGNLDRKLGGTLLSTPDFGYVTNDQSNNQASYQAPRRSLYLPVIRNAVYDLFTTFDYNDPSVHIEQRPATTIASQALYLLNSPLVLEQSRKLAERLLGESLSGDPRRIARGALLVFGRQPSAEEAALAERHLAAARTATGADQKPAAEARAWQSLCQVWLMSSGFVFVD